MVKSLSQTKKESCRHAHDVTGCDKPGGCTCHPGVSDSGAWVGNGAKEPGVKPGWSNEALTT
jgi:hypothetical protein